MNILFDFHRRNPKLSKGALGELIRASPEKFEKMSSSIHFTEKNDVVRELSKRVKILGDLSLG